MTQPASKSGNWNFSRAKNDFSKYYYSCLVINLTLPAKIVYDSYRGRADFENRIKELKYDFSIDDFVMNNL